ncbi:P-loop containing nucleoside triphosphate hydrolase protein [Pisolithus tinctorius]|nr:P-loop containing nucleoside triphosphate hydrolase protein [Pisolithus tinctorius]
MLSVSLGDRRSLEAFLDAMGGQPTLHQLNVKELFFTNEFRSVSDSDLVQQAWAACQAAILPHMAERFHTVGRIRTNTIPDEHMTVLAKISRDGDLLNSLKPFIMKNDVMPGITMNTDNLTLTCSRYLTRIRNSTQQLLQIETPKGVQLLGRAIRVEGRHAHIEISGPLEGNAIRSVTTFGKANLTSADACREKVILVILKGSTLLSHPLVKAIWFPNQPIWWMPSSHLKPKIPISCANLKVNPSQGKAIEKILSALDMDRVVLIQGPPGTGKTTVITAAVTSIISFPAASSRTIWIAAQSNVAVKNIAEKFAKIGFYDFALLVSKEFHFDWHEHLYEKLESRLIRSETFSREGVGASRQLRGARVILCTLGMLSNNHIEAFRHVNPVDILIFDEGSQIDVGSYLPVFDRFKFTLSKIVFIGDNKQLPPYGQREISTLHSIFEVNHLHKKAIFLDTQYRIPRVLGDFISQRVYNGKLKTCHANSVSLPCRFVDVERGHEERSGKSWIVRYFLGSNDCALISRQNSSEAQVVVQIAAAYQAKALDFRIITPYDAQRSLIERELQVANVRHEDKVFNIDSFQGNEAEHIIISLVRSHRLGFLVHEGRANVMLTRCKKTMIICTSRAFIWGLGASTLVGQLAEVLGPQAWVNGEIVV